MTSTSPYKSRSLAQSLAVQTQVHLAGTVGRLLKQIRDLERVAPLFVEARLVRSVDRPKPLTLNVAGVSTKQATRRVAGGFLYAAAGARSDISVHDNVVATRGEDSVCEIDDIEYEDQSKRFQLIGIRQAYGWSAVFYVFVAFALLSAAALAPTFRSGARVLGEKQV